MAKNRTNKPSGMVATPETSNPIPGITVSIDVPSVVVIPLLKSAGVSVERQLSDLGPEALKRVFLYGLNRFNRDGATPDTDHRDEKGNSLGKLTSEEIAAEAIRLSDEKWNRLVAGTLRTRESGPSDGGLLAETRTLAVKALVKRGVARKAIPKLPDHDSIRAALASHEGLYDKVLALAKTVVAARQAEEL